ncbi:MAG: DUF357 domain-containing protein [Candidatus Diapherotrites archaeon]|nr:DUF357 domain-containing protein [Candidatus Diapherotrites archaeon]
MDSLPELKKKVEKYRTLTKNALEKVALVKGLSEKDKKTAQAFLEMARNYFSDAKYFEEKKDFLTALAAYSYAHAWLDAGVKAGWFDHKVDDRLFVLP